jgi:Uma2 family endonuclease
MTLIDPVATRSPAVEPTFEPEEFLALPETVAFELVDGKLVERNMGIRSSLVAMNVGRLLGNYLAVNPIGIVLGADASLQFFPGKPKQIRRADVSFVRRDRFPNGEVPDGTLKIAPDLAIEVISPNDLAWEVEEKVTEYRSNGVSLVWVVYPSTRSVHVIRPPGAAIAPKILNADDTISGEEILPGFSSRVAEFFAGIQPAS